MHFSPEQIYFIVGLSLLKSNPLFWALLVWELVWKSIALWKAARHNQLYWFIAIAVFNTVGILPIVYILFFQKNRKEKK